jgi:hypothetical protein
MNRGLCTPTIERGSASHCAPPSMGARLSMGIVPELRARLREVVLTALTLVGYGNIFAPFGV